MFAFAVAEIAFDLPVPGAMFAGLRPAERAKNAPLAVTRWAACRSSSFALFTLSHGDLRLGMVGGSSVPDCARLVVIARPGEVSTAHRSLKTGMVDCLVAGVQAAGVR